MPETLRIGSLFSGARAGGLDLAVEAVFGGRTAWHCEHDQAASKVLTHRWPGVPNLGDITAADWTQVEPVDVLCGGFPCFPAGTLIDAGEDGLRPIETIRVGDMVLTHERRRRAVISVMRREAEDVLVIKAMGAPDFRATAEHPFYVLRGKNATSPEWVAAGELRSGDYLAMPLDDAGTEPVLGPHVAYVVGRWLGDGWIVDHKRTSDIVGKRGSRVNSRVHKAIICCAHSEAEEVSAALSRAGLHSTRADERTVVKFHISSAAFVKALRPFGRGAAGKRLPGWTFSLPQDERAALLQGWLDADGCRTQGQWKGATVSEELAHGMARLARSVHQRAVSVHRIRPPLTTAIEGREVNQRPWFQVVIPDRNKVAFVRGGFAWVPLRSVSEAPPCEVFNISVDEDESYTAWGYTVHNCQDVSSAGRRAGIREGTRSGLWSHFAEAVAALRPRFVAIENVRGLLSATAHRAVESDDATLGGGTGGHVLRAAGAVLGDLADLGYDAAWATIAASAVGAPHKRERVFIVAHPADTDIGGLQGPQSTPGRVMSDRSATANTSGDGWHEGWPESARLIGRPDAAERGHDDVALLPTPSAADGNGGHLSRSGDRSGELLLPGIARAYGNGELLPTPNASDCTGGGTHPDNRDGHSRHLIDYTLLHGTSQWGKYADAIHRWERITRPAPAPTEPNRNGKPRLAASFSEWMMGWPAGWCTDPAIGLSRNDQLRICGNGVVPQQAIAALRLGLGALEAVAESVIEVAE